MCVCACVRVCVCACVRVCLVRGGARVCARAYMRVCNLYYIQFCIYVTHIFGANYYSYDISYDNLNRINKVYLQINCRSKVRAH